jgi:uncharacterized protein (PEP-CTERM system associated)
MAMPMGTAIGKAPVRTSRRREATHSAASAVLVMKKRPSIALAIGGPLWGMLAVVAAGAAAQTGGLGFGDWNTAITTGATGGRPPTPGGSLGNGGREFYLVPTLSSTMTLTDNVNLSATDRQAGLNLSVTPGIQIGGQTGRVRGFLDYDLTLFLSSSDQESIRFRNSLRARVNAEAVSNWLFIDAGASITQEFINPFGTLSPNSNLNNSNLTQVTTLDFAPYIKGQLGGQVNYLGRAFYRFTDSGTSQASNSTLFGGLLSLDSTTRWSRLSWGLDFSYREVQFTDRRDEFDQFNVLSLHYAITPFLKATLRGNVETSNLVSLNSETTSGWGGGLLWNPSPRTTLFLEYDQRIFGSSHLYFLNYRTPRTVWSISSRQSLSTGQSVAGREQGSAYDLVFAQFATVEPDPVARAQLVANFLRATGIDPNATLGTGYLPSQVTLQLRNEASAAWLGQRSNLIFNIYETQAESLQPALLNPDDILSGGNVVKWRGFSASWSHRLTPRSALTLNYDQRQTTESIGTQQTDFWIGRLIWSYQLAERANLSVTARHAVQSGDSPYQENALLANLSMQF